MPAFRLGSLLAAVLSATIAWGGPAGEGTPKDGDPVGSLPLGVIDGQYLSPADPTE